MLNRYVNHTTSMRAPRGQGEAYLSRPTRKTATPEYKPYEAGYSRQPMAEIPLRAANADTAASAVHGQPRRLLIADDDRDGALILATLLELEGYEVRTVHGGQEALDVARTFKPHVVLLDIGMPKITGYDAARRLRQRYGEECPVLIAVTAWKQASDKILANLAGFDHHVAKPYDPNELVKLLAKTQRATR
jgi:CheY-like chemotaxis protein